MNLNINYSVTVNQQKCPLHCDSELTRQVHKDSAPCCSHHLAEPAHNSKIEKRKVAVC